MIISKNWARILPDLTLAGIKSTPVETLCDIWSNLTVGYKRSAFTASAQTAKLTQYNSAGLAVTFPWFNCPDVSCAAACYRLLLAC
ncbi:MULTISPECIES: hypothetical protein [Pseudomonas]|uniref:Uncharacterized protein n=1 Tax=Pseudomonas urmiensis TaxID=2745493 RepID=A0A923JW16_9PSED|nr:MULTISPECIES: hypothetical protein [Pseudomonas]MBV4537056.1 hypothetical protein [Pseudomonas urmiensis]